MAFRIESDLREPVMDWLCDAGFDVSVESPILRHVADVLGWRGSTLIAVEMKLHRWRQALQQAISYQLAADRVWVAMPLVDASRAYRQRWRFESEGVGLLAVDDEGRVRCPIRPRTSPRLLPFLRAKVLEELSSPRSSPEAIEGDRLPKIRSHEPSSSRIL